MILITFFLFSLENGLKNLINQKVIKEPITWNLSLNQLSKAKTIYDTNSGE